jgi:hypothetical protein
MGPFVETGKKKKINSFGNLMNLGHFFHNFVCLLDLKLYVRSRKCKQLQEVHSLIAMCLRNVVTD